MRNISFFPYLAHTDHPDLVCARITKMVICHLRAVGERVGMESAARNNLELLTAARHMSRYGPCSKPHRGVCLPPCCPIPLFMAAFPGIKPSTWDGVVTLVTDGGLSFSCLLVFLSLRGGCGTLARAVGEAGRDLGQWGLREVVPAWPLMQVDPMGINHRGVVSVSVMGLQG